MKTLLLLMVENLSVIQCVSSLNSRHYKLSVVLLCFVVPTLVPWYFWGESLAVGYFVPGLLRYALILNATWLVNSAAHMWGNRPYDKTINPRENPLVALSAIGKKRACPLTHIIHPEVRNFSEIWNI